MIKKTTAASRKRSSLARSAASSSITDVTYSALPISRRPASPSLGPAGLSVPCHLPFFFQAEDGIRDESVTGVQTSALPIFADHGIDRRRDAHLRRVSPGLGHRR